jgi:hypothetical protein
MTEMTLAEIRTELDQRLADRKAAQERLLSLKRANARAILRGEKAKRILERA